MSSASLSVILLLPVALVLTSDRAKEIPSVDELIDACPENQNLLIRKAMFDNRTAQHLCTDDFYADSHDMDCYYKGNNRTFSANFSLTSLSRVYSGVRTRDRVQWRNIVNEFNKLGNYTISYLCVDVRGRSPCKENVRKYASGIAIFLLADQEARRSQSCQVDCNVTAEPPHKHEDPFIWEHQLVLQDGASVDNLSISYKLDFPFGKSTKDWKRFQPSSLEERSMTHAVGMQLRFVLPNVSKVVRFWLDFPRPTVTIVCEKTETTTSAPAVPTSPHGITVVADGIVLPTAVISVVVLLVGIAIIVVIVLATKRHKKRARNEEASQLLATPPSFPNPDPDSSHHPQDHPHHHLQNLGLLLVPEGPESPRHVASNPSPSHARHVTGSGNDEGNAMYSCLNYNQRQGRQVGDNDDYSHVDRNRSDGDYAQFQREAERRQEVLDNTYDHTFEITD